nr:zinc knuckle CX2CX4HX4C [Tanacetum cinerariifolium]
MCLNPWGRNSYARILVELNSENEVMESSVVAIPLPKGEGHYLETLDVEYEWWSPRCSKCKIFDHEDYDCPSKIRKAVVSSSYGNGGICDTNGKNKKKGAKKPIMKQGFRVTKPNLMYRHVSKSSTTSENTSKSKAPPTSNEAVNEAAKPKDDIDLGQLQGNMKKLMDENKVLELNTDCVTKDVAEVHSVPNSHDASTSKQNNFSKSDESEVEEVFVSFGKPGGGFLDDLEDDLDRYDGYEAHIYDLTEQEQALCDRYDICLNGHCKK